MPETATSDTPDAVPAAPERAVRVKICGVTRPEDAALADAAGADAIGMIFAARSKRRLEPVQAAEIAAAVGPFTARVGVFVDAPLERVREIAAALRLDAVQLHGNEQPAYAAALRPAVQVIKAWSFAPGLRRAVMARYPADAVLLDGLRPGSGEAFDWEAARELRGFPRLVLAGGLTPETVAAGVRALAPYGVDVASGVESAPGIKDPERLRAFVAAVRGAAHPAG